MAHHREDSDSASRSWASSLLRGFNASVTNNAPAFGFSITVTVTYGVVSAHAPAPTSFELLGFALAAVAAFALLNLAVVATVSARDFETEPARVLLVATATDFLAVGGGVGVAMVIVRTLNGWAPWVLAPLGAGITYILIQSIEIAVGDRRADD